MTRFFLVVAISLLMSGASAAAPSDPPGRICSKFETLYHAWRREGDKIAVSSRTRDYVALPSFRKIVALGVPVVPCLAAKMSKNEDDFMLAEAVFEICGWDRGSVASNVEQDARDYVLQRLKESGGFLCTPGRRR